jgi:O-antigen ligase
MLSQVLQMAQLGVAAMLMVVLSVELARRPIVLVLALLGLYGWTLITDAEMASVRVMGISISAIDSVNVVAFGASLIRMRRGPRGWQWALLAAVGLILFFALRAALQFGDAALLGFRSELYFVVPALFVSTLPPQSIARVVRVVALLGVTLAAFSVFRWVALAMGIQLTPLAASSGYLVQRVIDSSSAIWIAFAGVLGVASLLGSQARSARWRILGLTGLAFTVVLLAQHRSVWVATAVMVSAALVVTRRRWFMKAAVVVTGLLAVVAIEGIGLGNVGVVGESLALAASDARTWEWRLERWGVVWSTHAARGVEAILFGSGYGYGWVSGAVGVWEVSPHNGYLQIAVRIGLLGASLVFMPYALSAIRLVSSTNVASRAVWLWVLGSLIYYVPYSASPLTGVALGAAVVLLAEQLPADPS